MQDLIQEREVMLEVIIQNTHIHNEMPQTLNQRRVFLFFPVRWFCGGMDVQPSLCLVITYEENMCCLAITTLIKAIENTYVIQMKI